MKKLVAIKSSQQRKISPSNRINGILFSMISVVILTKNNEKTLASVLKSLQDFPEVILLDSGSLDATCEVAKTFPNVRIHHSPWIGFGKMRNLGASLASNDWILALDSDEVLSNDLQKEIVSLGLDSSVVYDIPFYNFYNGKLIKWCGWYPESHLRLYQKSQAQFTPSEVHEKLLTDTLKIQKLKNPILHYSYSSVEDFLSKMQLYSSLFAKQYKNKKKSSFARALFHGSWAFFKSYLLQRGFLGGKEGFIISVYQANTAFYKYLKLLEENSK